MGDKQKFAFDKTNFILLAIGMAVVILGFILMTRWLRWSVSWALFL